jgi:phosphoglucosamine mutase
MVKHLISNKQFEGGVVGTAMSNIGLELALRKLSVPFKRTKVGDRYVMAELHKSSWMLGGEPSGHIVHLGLTTTGDGIISALQVLSAMCKTEKTLSELKSGMIKLPQILINVTTSNADRALKSRLIQKMIKDIEVKLGKQGRVLLRPSGTEPVIRVMVEGEQKQMVQVLAKELAAMVQRECA